ncbi:hypothetical protein LCGC14_0498740 [marine sediment metagenome]|uniref:Uncharacterized protein n=1 Tax=marine sediment metagenome TaxID=412755 RepID=A0A0F9S4L6_9ZZZZ
MTSPLPDGFTPAGEPCPRCSGSVQESWGELTCLNCGYYPPGPDSIGGMSGEAPLNNHLSTIKREPYQGRRARRASIRSE